MEMLLIVLAITVMWLLRYAENERDARIELSKIVKHYMDNHRDAIGTLNQAAHAINDLGERVSDLERKS